MIPQKSPKVIVKAHPEVLDLAPEEKAGPRPLESHLSALAEPLPSTVLQTKETESKKPEWCTTMSGLKHEAFNS